MRGSATLKRSSVFVRGVTRSLLYTALSGSVLLKALGFT